MSDRHVAFQEARTSRSKVVREDYTELILELIETRGEARIRDIAKEMGVSHVTALRAIQRLRSEGYVKLVPLVPIELTPKGKELAKVSQMRHEILYQFLLKLGVPEEVAKTDVEGVEHFISSVTLDAIQRHMKQTLS